MTVVIPVWDSPYVEYLPGAVASVRRQGPEVPIVVVDNASTVEFAPPPGATVLRSDRRLSAGAARNLGLQRVATEYVIFLDADDELHDGALDILRAGITSDPRLVAYVTSIVEMDTGRRHRTPRPIAFGLSRIPTLFAFVTSIWSLYPTQGCAIMRSEWVRDAGGYGDSDLGEDWVLAVSLAFRGAVRLDRRPGRIYRLHRDSLMGEAVAIAQIRSAHRRIRERVKADPGIPAWARALLPMIAGLQFMVRLIVPVYRGARGSLVSRRARRQAAKAAGRRSPTENGRHM